MAINLLAENVRLLQRDLDSSHVKSAQIVLETVWFENASWIVKRDNFREVGTRNCLCLPCIINDVVMSMKLQFLGDIFLCK